MMQRRLLAIALLTCCGFGAVVPAARAATTIQPRITNIGVGVSGGVATISACVQAALPPAAGAVTFRGPRGKQQAPFQTTTQSCGPNAIVVQAVFPKLPGGRYQFLAACVLLEPDSSGNAGPPVPCLLRDVGFVSNFQGQTIATTCQVDFDPGRDMPLRSCAAAGATGNLPGAGTISASPAGATASATPTPRPNPPPSTTQAAALSPIPWTRAAVGHAFFAEGYTGAGYQEYISLLNPRPKAIDAAVTLYRADGASRTVHVKVPGLTRDTLNVNTLAPRASTAMRVDASGAVVAERALYVAGAGGHLVAGAALPARRWYVAEGYVGAGFADGLRIFNPYDAAAQIDITSYDGSGKPRASRFLVPGGTRMSIALDDIAPTGGSALIVDSSQAVVVESVIRQLNGAASAAMAVPAPQPAWYFPDGGTQPGDQEFLSLFNPAASQAAVRLTLITPHGLLRTLDAVVAPRARFTITLNDYARVADLAVVAQADRAIVVQEVRYRAGGGVSLVNGVPQPAAQWGLAEGYAGGPFREWITLLNPGTRSTTVTVRLVGQRGYFGILTIIVAAKHLHRLYVNGLMPSGAVAAVIQADRPIVAGRTLDFDSGKGLSTTSAVAIGGK